MFNLTTVRRIYVAQDQGIRRTVVMDFLKSKFLKPQSLWRPCSLSNVHRTFS